jgi:hypothetical protein
MDENYQQAPAVQPQNEFFMSLIYTTPALNFFTGQMTRLTQNLSSRLCNSKNGLPA